MNARLALIALVAAQLASSAAADNFSWNFQRTGYRSSAPGMPQTALSMRGDLSWPVVYGIDQGVLNAYSLFPVLNTSPKPISGEPNYWHQIGTNLTKSPVPSQSVYLQGASGAPDGFGVSLQTPAISASVPDITVWGTSQGGFQPPQINTQALKFDADGNPFVATSSLIIPSNPRPSEKLFDVALSGNGDVGAVTQTSSGFGPMTFWQRSPLLGGNWFSSPITNSQQEQTLFAATVDLTYDSGGRPHVVGVNRISSINNIAAYRFDIMTGAWTSSILDATFNSPPITDVAAAANDEGIIGAAWVNNGVLKYAYMDTNEPTPSWVITTVASATPAGMQLEMSQGVGLAYDKAGLPVISFVDRQRREIWIAYDPPVALAPHPGPADFNGDGFVDGDDLHGWTLAFGDSPAADADDDGDSDGSDFLAWQRNITPPANPAAATPIPEPATFSFILMAATAVIGASRRQGSQPT